MSKPAATSITILKLGGNVLNDEQQLALALGYFSGLPGPKILVHGGGRRASDLLQHLSIPPKMMDGRRVTDAETLEVVVMVYAGLLNKQLVARLQALGTNALGLSGADGNLIKATKRPTTEFDYGFAGDITAINTPLLEQLLASNTTPVLCAITHNGKGQLLNTNADTIAAETAAALANIGASVSLRYCFEMPGVMADFGKSDQTIPRITPANYPGFLASGVISGGMKPKLANAMSALETGVAEVVIGNIESFISGQATVICQS